MQSNHASAGPFSSPAANKIFNYNRFLFVCEIGNGYPLYRYSIQRVRLLCMELITIKSPLGKVKSNTFRLNNFPLISLLQLLNSHNVCNFRIGEHTTFVERLIVTFSIQLPNVS